MNPIDAIFLYKVLDQIGDLADQADRVGASNSCSPVANPDGAFDQWIFDPIRRNWCWRVATLTFPGFLMAWDRRQ